MTQHLQTNEKKKKTGKLSSIGDFPSIQASKNCFPNPKTQGVPNNLGGKRSNQCFMLLERLQTIKSTNDITRPFNSLSPWKKPAKNDKSKSSILFAAGEKTAPQGEMTTFWPNQELDWTNIGRMPGVSVTHR